MTQNEIPIREGYYDVYNSGDTWFIEGPSFETRHVVEKWRKIQGNIYDVYYRPDNQNSGVKIIRCHIMNELE